MGDAAAHLTGANNSDYFDFARHDIKSRRQTPIGPQCCNAK
jgi:hypothetical protein